MIDKRKLNRLIKHLELLEEKTGRKCILTPREGLDFCPMSNFGPGTNKTGSMLIGGTHDGVVLYRSQKGKSKNYPIYSFRDSLWWFNLPYDDATQYTQAVSQYLKDRKKNGRKPIHRQPTQSS